MYVSYLLLWIIITAAANKWVENKGIWYYISNDAVTYEKASERCVSMNAHLAVITNTEQDTFLSNLFNDEKPRWIGMSSNMTSKHKCRRNKCIVNWFWSIDWTCDNKYLRFPYKYELPTDEKNYGVALKKLTDIVGTPYWEWIVGTSSKKHGYICQWECKELFLQSGPNEQYNGNYQLVRYYQGNFVYVKEMSNGDTILLKSNKYNKWSVLWSPNNDQKYHYEAVNDLNLYVPYGKSIWKTIKGNNINLDLICVECDKSLEQTRRENADNRDRIKIVCDTESSGSDSNSSVKNLILVVVCSTIALVIVVIVVVVLVKRRKVHCPNNDANKKMREHRRADFTTVAPTGRGRSNQNRQCPENSNLQSRQTYENVRYSDGPTSSVFSSTYQQIVD